jgi:hypothetical protein
MLQAERNVADQGPETLLDFPGLRDRGHVERLFFFRIQQFKNPGDFSPGF